MTSPDEMGGLPSLVTRLRAAGGTAALCSRCHERIPSVSGVGLTVFVSRARRFVLGTSGLLIDRVEDLQIRLDEGPCVEAFTSRQPVLVEHLADQDARQRWPRFADEALRAGVAAVFTFPVLAEDQPVAVLDLCRSSPGPLPGTAYAQATTFAAAASTLLVDDLNGGASAGATVSLSAARVQQATGMVMGQATTGAADALHQLRDHATHRDVSLAVVVDEVLAGMLRFDTPRAS
ncbi:hypothetical protein FB565_008795 [Actinoplanes lutulentus]|uniref:GAF domain-containing protein n=1 Tax=Actinoplanes lutulentus TaxID=1287878 RepID=A0A327YZ00_9ACTN|nr:GAF and ANTAR domain-containing protein [Actinoplanes lutulentus]MBB2949009.1 hypothetical protein [Actinoplanes lutulentus]RAK26213.1 GAF domain-containing protein [Actinoplanes lutulentus]